VAAQGSYECGLGIVKVYPVYKSFVPVEFEKIRIRGSFDHEDTNVAV
jgi:hypothetical protein